MGYVWFWGEKCPVCHQLAWVPERLGARTYCVDEPEGLAEAAFRDVRATPTLIEVDEEDEEVRRWVGEDVLRSVSDES